MIRFEVERAKSGAQHYFWHVVSVGNNARLATSETYVAKQDAMHAINLVKQGAPGAEVVDKS